uniref:Putative ribonuclease H-like domain-containing protein n=1 Tax=Tanacetum cinerariifolium TaxID=118510 RepID=A0A6L2P307_TANCI|nr:putative ribonuclease H-like domain-containing protein [Tanacetum cinerariifolium]
MDKENPWGKDGPGKDVELHLYRSMIGSLMYLTASRPDIMFAVCACARHQVTPKECHLHAVKRIFRYLKGHPKLGLWYPKASPFDLVAYSDSNYGRAYQDRKSTTGGSQFLGRRLILWQCKKQTIVATSTTEAEYVAAASCCGQVLWIQNQLLDYGYNFMNTKIYIDNNSAICIVNNPVYHSKTKYIEIRYHFIRDFFEKKLISVDHIHTDENVADLLTKPFDAGRFQYLVVSIGMLLAAVVKFCGFRISCLIMGSACHEKLCQRKSSSLYFVSLMHEKFQMSAMGELNFFLGLQVLQKEDGIFLSQDKPDIMFAVCACARHQVTPKECHLHAVKRIFRYLKGHPKLGLWYPKASSFDLVAYSDSDYGGASQDRKSTTGGSQFLGRRLISWQ